MDIDGNILLDEVVTGHYFPLTSSEQRLGYAMSEPRAANSSGIYCRPISLGRIGRSRKPVNRESLPRTEALRRASAFCFHTRIIPAQPAKMMASGACAGTRSIVDRAPVLNRWPLVHPSQVRALDRSAIRINKGSSGVLPSKSVANECARKRPKTHKIRQVFGKCLFVGLYATGGCLTPGRAWDF